MVKEVGEALNKYRYKNQTAGVDIPCIGIASWGYTAGNDQLNRSLSITNETNIYESRRIRQHAAIDAVHTVRKFLIRIVFLMIIDRLEKQFMD